MDKKRKKGLEKNLTRMFWIRAFLNLNVINIVVTLFYLQRGLSLSQVFYLSIIWSVVNLLFEVPSSYLADRWGRKKTIILGIFFNLVSLIIYIFSYNLWWFIIAMCFAALSFACFSGTDDAFVYDTNKELKREKESLKALGKYYSARSVFKIITPLIGALIAQSLLDWQFITLILIDLIVALVALIISFRLVEPNHYTDVEKQEAGIIKDSLKIIRHDWFFVRAILSRTLIFIACFIIWRFHQEFFIEKSVSILTLGIMWSLIHVILFLFNQNIKLFFPKKLISFKINFLNYFFLAGLSAFILTLYFYPHIYLLIVLYALLDIFETSRWSLYVDFFNKKSHSFNRSTTLSLSNFLKSILDIPLLFLASILIDKNINYPFILALVISVIAILFFRIKDVENRKSAL